MERFLEPLKSLNWNNLEEIKKASKKVLITISSPEILTSFINSMLSNPELLDLCEHYDFFDKLVLYRDREDRFRLRLHIFLSESHKDRPHYHRWVYSTLVLRGEYQHLIYGTEDEFHNRNVNPKDMTPIMIQEVCQKTFYTLSHNVIHSIDAKPFTVSLFLRGPALKRGFMIFDRKTGRQWWEYGREAETIEEVKRKIMSRERLKMQIDNLRKWGLIIS